MEVNQGRGGRGKEGKTESNRESDWDAGLIYRDPTREIEQDTLPTVSTAKNDPVSTIKSSSSILSIIKWKESGIIVCKTHGAAQYSKLIMPHSAPLSSTTALLGYIHADNHTIKKEKKRANNSKLQ